MVGTSLQQELNNFVRSLREQVKLLLLFLDVHVGLLLVD